MGLQWLQKLLGARTKKAMRVPEKLSWSKNQAAKDKERIAQLKS